MKKRKAPIFIGGCPRSGTSFIYWMIAAHPELAYPDAGLSGMINHKWIRYFDRINLPATILKRFHRIFFPANEDTLGYDRRFDYLDLFPRIPQEGRFVWQDVLKDNNLTKMDLSPEVLKRYGGIRNRVRTRYNSILKMFGSERFVDKYPGYLVYLDALMYLFPDAYMVSVIRDGRAVVNSHSYALKFRKNKDGSSWAGENTKWWGESPPNRKELEKLPIVERVCHQWNYYMDLSQAMKEKYGDRFCTVKYEDVVANTRKEIQTVYDFCGLTPWGDEVLPDNSESSNEKWKAKAGDTFDDPIWTKKASIEESELKYLEIMRGNLEKLGYVKSGADLY